MRRSPSPYIPPHPAYAPHTPPAPPLSRSSAASPPAPKTSSPRHAVRNAASDLPTYRFRNSSFTGPAFSSTGVTRDPSLNEEAPPVNTSRRSAEDTSLAFTPGLAITTTCAAALFPITPRKDKHQHEEYTPSHNPNPKVPHQKLTPIFSRVIFVFGCRFILSTA